MATPVKPTIVKPTTVRRIPNLLDANNPYPKLLMQTELVKAHANHSGPTINHLLIRPGDVIEIFAHVDPMTAIGFNTSTNMTGKFPMAVAKKNPSQCESDPEIYVCKTSLSHVDVGHLLCKPGQYVRSVTPPGEFGGTLGFNHETLEFGRFYPDAGDFDKIKWERQAKDLEVC